jgi:hypothetical protein
MVSGSGCDQNWARGTRDKYKTTLTKLLHFIGIEAEDSTKSLEARARTFAKNSCKPIEIHSVSERPSGQEGNNCCNG